MRHLIAVAAVFSLLSTGWNQPTVRADDATQLDKIIEQVAKSLDAAELSATTKEAILNDLKQSLPQTLSSNPAEQPSASIEQDQALQGDSDVPAAEDAEQAANADNSSERSRQQARAAQRELRREQRREADNGAAQSRRGELLREEAERQLRRAVQRASSQSVRFAIGVMLEQSDDSDSERQLVISDVFPGSPAAEADLQSGDVIHKIDGEAVTDAADVTRRVDQAGQEQKSLTLEIVRDDEVLTVEVKPSARPDNLAFDFGRPEWAFPAAPGMPGFGGWRDPQWRFPTPPAGITEERIQQTERQLAEQKQQLEELRRIVDELRENRAAEGADADDAEQD